jgi:thiol-disulfide isomerase/thioredoxin
MRWLLFALVPLSTLANAGNAEITPVKPLAPPRTTDARFHQQLAHFKGKPVLLNFWATWCEPCREEMPALHRLAVRGEGFGMKVLTVAVADNAKRVDEFLWEILPPKASLPVVHDREQVISRAWGVTMLPTTLLLDKRHRIVARGHGAIDWDAPAHEQQLKSLLH